MVRNEIKNLCCLGRFNEIDLHQCSIEEIRYISSKKIAIKLRNNCQEWEE